MKLLKCAVKQRNLLDVMIDGFVQSGWHITSRTGNDFPERDVVALSSTFTTLIAPAEFTLSAFHN